VVSTANAASLRETIEACEEIVPVARLADAHFRDHGRPLKIAIDEADWRFNNVSPKDVAFIRSSARNPDRTSHR
jgi:Holliday junction resolvase YEN1